MPARSRRDRSAESVHHQWDAAEDLNQAATAAARLRQTAFRAASRPWGARKLSFDGDVYHHPLPSLADLASAFPE